MRDRIRHARVPHSRGIVVLAPFFHRFHFRVFPLLFIINSHISYRCIVPRSRWGRLDERDLTITVTSSFSLERTLVSVIIVMERKTPCTTKMTTTVIRIDSSSEEKTAEETRRKRHCTHAVHHVEECRRRNTAVHRYWNRNPPSDGSIFHQSIV